MYVFKKVVFNFYKEFIFFNSYLKNYIKILHPVPKYNTKAK